MMDDGSGGAGACREHTLPRSEEEFFSERMDSRTYENWPRITILDCDLPRRDLNHIC